MAEIETMRPPTTSAPSTRSAAAVVDRTSKPASHLSEAFSGALEAAEAQFSIWVMKTTRLGVMAVIGLMAMAAASVLAIYGIILADRTLDVVLSDVSINGRTTAWLSPLVRAVLYLGGPSVVMLLTWHVLVGWGRVNETTVKEKADELASHKYPKKEADHGAFKL